MLIDWNATSREWRNIMRAQEEKIARLTAENARLREALRQLSFAAQTTGGTAGRDDALVAAIDLARAAMLAASPFAPEEK